MNICIRYYSLSKRFTKIFSTFGLLLFESVNIALSQVFDSSDLFYEPDKKLII